MILTQGAIKEMIDQSATLKLVAESYSEIAATKLAKIRKNIERNRMYASELANVYHIVKRAAEKQKVVAKTKRSGTVNVVLTSNHRFYGGLEGRLMQFYQAHCVISLGDTVVIGTMGRDFLHGVKFEHPYASIIFNQDLPNGKEMADLMGLIWRYERIMIYHSKMVSVLSQRPVLSEIGGIADLTAGITGEPEYYIFEPELALMMDFFDQQITQVLISQTFLESELARTAARLVSMEEAQRNSDAAVKTNRKLLGQVKRSQENAKVLEMMLAAVEGLKHTQNF